VGARSRALSYLAPIARLVPASSTDRSRGNTSRSSANACSRTSRRRRSKLDSNALLVGRGPPCLPEAARPRTVPRSAGPPAHHHREHLLGWRGTPRPPRRPRSIKVVLEPRHPTWSVDGVRRQLEARDAAWCLTDTAGGTHLCGELRRGVRQVPSWASDPGVVLRAKGPRDMGRTHRRVVVALRRRVLLLQQRQQGLRAA
jgi:hypothetical protein